MEKRTNRPAENELTRVDSVRKAFSILECFTPQRAEISLSELSRLCRIPKSTLLNQMRTMEQAGYVQKNPQTQNYRLGYKLMCLSYCVQAASPLMHYVIPVMEELQSATGQTVYLTSCVDGRVFYLQCIYASQRTQVYSVAGKTLPMHCTSSGKAMLSFMPEERINAIIARHGLPAVTHNTITDEETLLKELDEIRRRGYAVDNEEESVGVRCVAVPVLSAKGEVAGALSVSGSVLSVKNENIPGYATLLSQAAGVLGQYANMFPALQDG